MKKERTGIFLNVGGVERSGGHGAGTVYIYIFFRKSIQMRQVNWESCAWNSCVRLAVSILSVLLAHQHWSSTNFKWSCFNNHKKVFFYGYYNKWVLETACWLSCASGRMLLTWFFTCIHLNAVLNRKIYCQIVPDNVSVLHWFDCPLEGVVDLSTLQEEKTSSFFCNKCFFLDYQVCVCIILILDIDPISA